MTTILNLITIAFKNKWIRNSLLILVSIVVFYFCALSLRDKVFQQGYNAGISYQTQVNTDEKARAKQEFDILQAKADKERADLNKEIETLSENNRSIKKDLSDKQYKINQERIDYAKNPANTMSCFAPRDNGVLIINKSFPSNTYR